MDNRTRVGIVLGRNLQIILPNHVGKFNILFSTSGTGSNACYVERACRVQHWETERHNEHHVIIDIEWGAFGDNGSLDFIKTEFDLSLDLRSLLAKSFTLVNILITKLLVIL